MYEELFHSADRPFRATPDPKFYYPHDSIETARQTAVRAVLRAEGPVMILAGAGLGKSLLGMVIAADLGAKFDVVKLHAARLCSRRALLQNILFELQLPYRDLSEGELRFSILDRLEPSKDNAPDGILIIVDEAHTLPAKLLDELRIITNFTRGNQPRARMVLIGNLRLEHTLAEPQLESFNQRLAARCYLQPMNRQQTSAYIKHQLTVAGVNSKQVVTEDALNTVYAASEGVPRLANQVMDHALVLAITRAQCPISSALVEEAWSDLQQLPAPWHSGTDKYSGAFSGSETSQVSAVEFGSLDEEMGEALAAVDEVATESSLTTQSSVAAGKTDDDELGLADEPQANAAPRRANFFTAFAPVDEDFVDEISDALQSSSKQSAVVEPVAAEQELSEEFELLVRPRVAFDDTREAASSSIDSFFTDRPTDEQLLAFDDEQQQFDTMGVWENDPPLASIAPGTQRESTTFDTQPEPKCAFADEQPKSQREKLQPQELKSDISSNPFGDDFDEEITVDSSCSIAGQHATPAKIAPASGQVQRVASGQGEVSQPQASDADLLTSPVESLSSSDDEDTAEFLRADLQSDATAAVDAAAAADYVARIQEYADSISRVNQLAGVEVLTVDEVLGNLDTQNRNASAICNANQSDCINVFDDTPESWTVDVASLDVQNEVNVQHEIEDLVSQLNFAAFAIEPFSVEQISLEPQDLRRAAPADSIRSGQNEEIYALHRPEELSEKNVFNGWTGGEEHAQFDDDRDLLVVDEDLPVAVKAAGESQPPVTKMAPYSQLFANLRK